MEPSPEDRPLIPHSNSRKRAGREEGPTSKAERSRKKQVEVTRSPNVPGLVSPAQTREELLSSKENGRPRSISYGSSDQLRAPVQDSTRESTLPGKITGRKSLPPPPEEGQGWKPERAGGRVGGWGYEKDSTLKEEEQGVDARAKDGSVLVMAFLLMIFVGSGNRIFMKLQTYPMYNYPFFLNMLTTFIYIPVCFSYILPMLAFGTNITPEQTALPKYKFAIMGLLDSVASIMGVFAVNYIYNAAMIVLLQQAAIPISMGISKVFLKARYTTSQYIGAAVVICGIIITLIPTFAGGSSGASAGDEGDASTQIIWSIVQVLSCIPMCLSSVYKEKALGDDDMDVIYLNGWVAVFQFLASLLFAVPSAYAMGLPVSELPLNTFQGYQCFLGRNSQFSTISQRITSIPVDHCELAPYFVTAYLVFNIVYNVVLIVILKYGSANVLFLASTVMVPIGNVAFSLKFVPRHQDLSWSDTLGLVWILGGLMVYRFSTPLLAYIRKRVEMPAMTAEDIDREKIGLKKVKQVERVSTQNMAKYMGINQTEYLEPLIQTRLWKAQKARLLKSPEQIRSLYLNRLGIPPSPGVLATPQSRGMRRGSSPYMGKMVRTPPLRASPAQQGPQGKGGRSYSYHTIRSPSPGAGSPSPLGMVGLSRGRGYGGRQVQNDVVGEESDLEEGEPTNMCGSYQG